MHNCLLSTHRKRNCLVWKSVQRVQTEPSPLCRAQDRPTRREEHIFHLNHCRQEKIKHGGRWVSKVNLLRVTSSSRSKSPTRSMSKLFDFTHPSLRYSIHLFFLTVDRSLRGMCQWDRCRVHQKWLPKTVKRKFVSNFETRCKNFAILRSYLCTDLVAALASLKMNDFTHFE